MDAVTHDVLCDRMRQFYLANAAINAILGTYASGTAKYHRPIAPENEAPVYVVYRLAEGGLGQNQRVGMPSPLYFPKVRHWFYGDRTTAGWKGAVDLFNAFYALTTAGSVENRFTGNWGTPAQAVQLATWELESYFEEYDPVAGLPFLACDLAVKYVKG